MGGFSSTGSAGSAPTKGKSLTDLEKEKPQQNIPAIVGGTIGGFVVLSLILILVWLVVRNKKKRIVYPNPVSNYQTTPNYDIDLAGSDNHASYTTPTDTQRTPLMAEIKPFTGASAMANADAYNPQPSLYQDGGLGHSTGTAQDGAASPPSRPYSYQDPFSDEQQSYQPYLQQPPQPQPGRPMSVATLSVSASPYTPPQSQPGADPVPQPAQIYDTSLLTHAPPSYSYGDGRQSVASTPTWGSQPLKFVPIA